MNDKYLGIILKQSDYREYDVIISVLLKGLGRYSFSCKGVKKLTSKNAMNIRPFLSSELIFDYFENKSIFSLKSATTIKNRKRINESLSKINSSSLICQIVDLTVFNDDEDIIESVYELLDFTLDALNDDEDVVLMTCFFIAKYLEIIGIMPNIDECTLCKNKRIVGISITEGGFICENCSNKAVLYSNLNIDNLRNFRLINKADFKDYETLKEISCFNKTDLDVLVKFFEFHTGIKLNSYQFLIDTL